jgi:hypothetical protein
MGDAYGDHHVDGDGAVKARLDHVADSVSGTQTYPSGCSDVFVDQSAESVAALDLVWRAWPDEA